MTHRPRVLLSCAMTIDGYIDDTSTTRLLLSNEADFDRVDAVRADHDAILVGATTIRRDNPRLLIRADHRRRQREAAGRPPNPIKVTLTRGGDLDPDANFFTTGQSPKLVYTTTTATAPKRLNVRPPTVAGAALIVPRGLLDRYLGRRTEPAARYARRTAFVERRAIEAVLAAERRLGRNPQEMPHNNPGYDIRSVSSDGRTVMIEVKGRIAGAADFTITHNEVLAAKNLGDAYRLALVQVSPDGPHADQLRYLGRPFDGTATDDFRITKLTLGWSKTWQQGSSPH